MAYTTNINLSDGSRADTGIREQAEQAAEQIVSGKAVVMETDAGKKAELESYFKKLGKKKLTALLKQCDFTGEETLPKCFSYFMDRETDEIAVYVPVTDALGHYAIVLFAQEDLQK